MQFSRDTAHGARDFSFARYKPIEPTLPEFLRALFNPASRGLFRKLSGGLDVSSNAKLALTHGDRIQLCRANRLSRAPEEVRWLGSAPLTHHLSFFLSLIQRGTQPSLSCPHLINLLHYLSPRARHCRSCARANHCELCMRCRVAPL